MSATRMHGWSAVPRVGVVVPDRSSAGWADAAWWCALLEAWGIAFETTSTDAVSSTRWTTLVVPVAAVDERLDRALATARPAAVLLAGRQTGGGARPQIDARVTRFDASV